MICTDLTVFFFLFIFYFLFSFYNVLPTNGFCEFVRSSRQFARKFQRLLARSFTLLSSGLISRGSVLAQHADSVPCCIVREHAPVTNDGTITIARPVDLLLS